MAEMTDISESMVNVELPPKEGENKPTEGSDTSGEDTSSIEQISEERIQSEVSEVTADETQNSATEDKDASGESDADAKAAEADDEQLPQQTQQISEDADQNIPEQAADVTPVAQQEVLSESVHTENAKYDHFNMESQPQVESKVDTEEAPTEAVKESSPPKTQEPSVIEEKSLSKESADEGSISSEGESDPFVMVKKDEVPRVEDLSPDAVKEPEEPEHKDECHLLKGDGDKEDEWLFVLGHEKLKKKVLKAGQGVGTRPVHGNTVTIRCVGRLPDGTEVDKDDSLTFVLGDGDVIQALDLCVGLMEMGEVGEIVTEAQYAYGSIGRDPDIPGNVVLSYEVEVLSSEKSPVYKELPVAERVKHADRKRERGNFLYARNEHSAAINSYTRALKILDDSGENHNGENTSDIQALIDMQVKCYNNLAAAQIKIEAWDAALKSCEETLKVQPENVKALFRKGKCLAGTGETDPAINCLRKALKLDPESKIIHQELSRLTTKQKAQQKSERELYQKMLGTDKQAKKDDAKEDDSSWWKYGVAGAVVLGAAAVGAAFYKSSS